MTDELRFLLNYCLRTTFDPVIDESDRDKNAVVVQVCKPRDRKPPFTWSKRIGLNDGFTAEVVVFLRQVREEFQRDWL